MKISQVITYVNGKWKQNCYLIYNNNNNALIIDPGSDPGGIKELITEYNLKPLAILNTHAHYDHIGAVSALIELYGIPFYLNENDQKLLKQANLYRILFESNDVIKVPTFDQNLTQKTISSLTSDFNVQTILTPGHTQGSVCLKINDYLFTGDTLMQGGVGRTDLPGGDKNQIYISVELLRSLSLDTVAFPGHGHPFLLHNFFNKS